MRWEHYVFVTANDASYDNKYDYYLGRVIGDVVASLIGAGGVIKGLVKIVKSFLGGVAVTVTSGGVWKMANSVKNLGSKATRMGTYNANLIRIGD